MNLSKETIFAILAGLALGTLTALGAWKITQKKEITLPSIQQKASLPPKPTLTMTLTQPENEALFSKPEASVSGQTQAGTQIIINGPGDDQALMASSDGSFSAKVNLEEGQNEIVVTALTVDGLEKSETRTVTYTKEEF